MRFVSLLAIAALALLGACGGDDTEGCTTSTDCASGRCVDGMCVAVPDGGGSCVDSDCDDGNPCNGEERCGAADACQAGTSAADGTACDADGSASTSDVCSGGLCAPARCGDGIVDMAGGEVCDDGNDVAGDGCDGCRYSCTEDADCADENECDGTETCNTATHVCAAGTALMDGADCAGTVGSCLAGTCVPRMCMTAEECTDANACTGVEACTDMACVAGTPLDCDDMVACTADTCSPTTGCVHALVDADRDGHAPSTLGACGDDCDDANATVFGGSPDGCDGLDNDCDMRVDEDEATVWYADCDGDNFAPMGGTSITACARPAASLTGCPMGGGAWVTRAPVDLANADCNDENATAYPTQAMYQTTAMTGVSSEADFDYNCNGTEEPQLTTLATCASGGFIGCILAAAGWVGTIPGCGVEGVFATGCSAAAGCTPVGTARLQPCR